MNRIAVCIAVFCAAVGSATMAPAAETARFDTFAYAGHDAVFDAVTPGAGQFANPILSGFYPDPSIVRVGTDFYLVNSTFTFFPGIPVFHSTDLVHWSQIGNAVDRPGQFDFSKLEVSRGLYAPDIAYRDGTFYIVNTCVECGGNFVVTAKNPAGPWSNPTFFAFEGIDPGLFFDADGKAYIVNNGAPEGKPLYNGHRAIWIQEFDPKTLKMVGPRTVIVNGGTDISKKPIWIEGPHLFAKDGWYYLICAEGGTADQHSEVVFRSKSVWGPFVPYAGNPILTQRDLPANRPFPVTSTGHAKFVATPDGAWWSVFLGTRPYQGDLYNKGRETFLLPVTWHDGWPIILEKGKAVPVAVEPPFKNASTGAVRQGNFSYVDSFDQADLGPQWLRVRTAAEKWYTVANRSLSLDARPVAIGSDGQPSFVGQRLQHETAKVSIHLQGIPVGEGARAGLVAFQNSHAFYFLGLVRQGGNVQACVTRRTGAGDAENGTVLACVPVASDRIWLKIALNGAKIDFQISPDNTVWTNVLTGADGTVLSTQKAGGFVGTVVGPYAYAPQ